MKVTLEGKKNMEASLQSMTEELKKVIEEKAKAYEMTGDTWHDNPYFLMMEASERDLTLKIQRAKKMLREAEVIESSGRNMESVDIGSIVKCRCVYGIFDGEKIFEIVGHAEADLAHGKIDYQSPVGKNIMGLKLGETVSFKVPKGTATYTVLKFYSDREEAESENV